MTAIEKLQAYAKEVFAVQAQLEKENPTMAQGIAIMKEMGQTRIKDGFHYKARQIVNERAA